MSRMEASGKVGRGSTAFFSGFHKRSVSVAKQLERASLEFIDVHVLQGLNRPMPVRDQLRSHDLGQPNVAAARGPMEFTLSSGLLESQRHT